MALKVGDTVTTVATMAYHIPSGKQMYVGSGHGEIVRQQYTNTELSFHTLVDVAWVADSDVDETPTVAQLSFQFRDVHKVKVRRAELVHRIAVLETELHTLLYRLERVEDRLKYTPFVSNGSIRPPWETEKLPLEKET